jgi:hypothetical protein
MSTKLLNDRSDRDCAADFRSQVNRSYLCVPLCRRMQLFIDGYLRLPGSKIQQQSPETHLSLSFLQLSSVPSNQRKCETRHFINNQVSPHIYELLDLLTYKSFISISTHLIPAINIQSAAPPPTKSSPPSTKQTQLSSTPPSPQHEKHSKAHGVPIPAPNVQNSC